MLLECKARTATDRRLKPAVTCWRSCLAQSSTSPPPLVTERSLRQPLGPQQPQALWWEALAPVSAVGLPDTPWRPAAPVQWCPAAGLCAERPAHEAEPVLQAQVEAPHQLSVRAQSLCWRWPLQHPWLHRGCAAQRQGLLGCCLQCQPVALPTCVRISRLLIAGTVTTLCDCVLTEEALACRFHA